MRNHRSHLTFPERWPLATLALSDNVADRCRAASASYALSAGRTPWRTLRAYVKLAMKVPS